MLRRAAVLKRADDENVDSGAETAESDCSRMSSSGIDLVSRRVRQQRQQQLLLMHLHLLANPGDSLLLQHTLDRLLRWLCPSLRIFHVSERASPFRTYPRLCPVAGYPSLAITFFLHEAYGEERILKVLDFFQRPPWHYHHTESCGSRTGGIHITSSSSPSNALLRPYLLPSRDFYSLGAGMPVWGVRPVHCGGEILRVTLYSAYDNYEDAVRLYETVLQRQAEEQKAGFCWFTLHMEPGLCLQLALKQLSPGVRVEPCSSAVLQFSVEEIGQLVPLLPNPCTPISATRWQTEDLDGNKVLFQVQTPAQPQRPLTCAFPLTGSSMPPRGMQLSSSGHSLSPCSLTSPLSGQTHRHAQRPRSDPILEKLHGGSGGAESLGSGSCCSTPPGSSCYSSQRSSPAPVSTSNHPDSPLRPSITHSLSHLLLEEDEEEPETNVDTGAAVSPRPDSAVKAMTRSSSLDLLVTLQSERPTTVGASAVEELAKEPSDCLQGTHTHLQRSSGTWGSGGGTDASRTRQSPSNRPLVANRTIAEPAGRNCEEPLDEFFI
ncbi:protein FAM124B isoform X1 [Oreochromis aureus]|uniref:protein FAM124B isoform X1 n=1 Tax=Oreochromis aureus TaxID=47969 RepID=UPI0012BD18ED|nr:protein FAM124B isoform X1 [Oreochromis aureus]XP_031587489.1 protein FAM124B isoform X1 [Oreochromis aureus]XP_031587490.1 protein FAM124B isoform X1 [Oreochromis aureus]XP_031587491.1 protein FAM124B isoform X1 [Oreochromis aureus]